MIDLDHVSKSYEKGQPAVNDITLHVNKGEFVFVVGESGSGKSTLIKLLLHELAPTSGQITVNDHVLSTLRHKDPAVAGSDSRTWGRKRIPTSWHRSPRRTSGTSG